jgi:hypothetical protein
VSWWKLDNTTTGIEDSAGSNDGTNNGTTEYAGFVNALAGESTNMDSSNLVVSDLQQTSGYSPYALTFDGADDFLEVPFSNDLRLTNVDFTISFWTKPSATGRYIMLENYSPTVGWGVFNDNGILEFLQDSGTWLVTSVTIPNNVWTHIVLVGDISATNLQVYKNGVSSGNFNTNLVTGNATGPLTIGSQRNGAGGFDYNGDLSNLAIWSGTALTSTEITEIYNQGVPSNLNTFSGTAPVAWWQLGSNSSFNTNWTCLDEIGTNNAVSVNMANDDIVNGVGYSANGLGTSSIDIIGDAPYSTANGLSENMDVLDRTLDTPIVNTHSIELDGIDDYVDSGTNPASLIGAMNPYSVSAWVYVAQGDLGSGTNYFIIGAQNGIDRWYFRIQSGYARFAYGTLLSNTTSTPVTGDQWNHIVFTYDGIDDFNTYINGVNKSTVTNSATQGVPSFNAFIGALNGGSGDINHFKGKIDELSLFNKELSGPQVLSMYNNGTPNNILPLNPSLWYRFESLTTNSGVVTVADDSGNGLTGTVKKWSKFINRSTLKLKNE